MEADGRDATERIWATPYGEASFRGLDAAMGAAGGDLHYLPFIPNKTLYKKEKRSYNAPENSRKEYLLVLLV